MAGHITEVRLGAFKSHREVVIPIAPLTVLIGRNGSGKSNALDALELLSRLAKGEEIRDAIEGNRRDAGPVRGGLEGSAPDGGHIFALGVSIQTADAVRVKLDVSVRVRPQVQILSERLRAQVHGQWRTLLESQEPDPDRSDLDAAVWNGTRGRNPHMHFRSSRLLTAQLPLRLMGATDGERLLLQLASELLAVLSGVFHLDPVPHLMRHYVPEQDAVLRRTADNLSAAVARLQREDKGKFQQLVGVMRTLPEFDVSSLDVGRGGFGEVMIALREKRGRGRTVIPARQMSDGMLRVLAIAAALLTGGGGLAIGSSDVEAPRSLTLVIEEIENGLHPSQAASLLRLVKETSTAQDYQVVLTTHSPVLLNALTGADHRGVVVIERDRMSGRTRARRLVDFPGYLRTLAAQQLGEAMTSGRLTEDAAREQGPVTDAALDALLGVG